VPAPDRSPGRPTKWFAVFFAADSLWLVSLDQLQHLLLPGDRFLWLLGELRSPLLAEAGALTPADAAAMGIADVQPILLLSPALLYFHSRWRSALVATTRRGGSLMVDVARVSVGRGALGKGAREFAQAIEHDAVIGIGRGEFRGVLRAAAER
jgi:hypothetical protein